MIRSLIASAARLIGLGSAPAVQVQSQSAVQATSPAVAYQQAAQSQRDADKAMLTRRLNARLWTWRTQARLLVAIGSTDVAYLRSLLQEVGARPAYQNDGLYGLKSRVGDRPRRRPRAYAYN